MTYGHSPMKIRAKESFFCDSVNSLLHARWLVSKASRLVLAVFGCFLFFVVIWNVEYGLWNEENTSVSQKVDLIGLATFSCTESNIYDEIENSGYSSCLYPLGSYALPDILLGGLGLILGFTGLSSALNFRLNSKGKSRRRNGRRRTGRRWRNGRGWRI